MLPHRKYHNENYLVNLDNINNNRIITTENMYYLYICHVFVMKTSFFVD